jgi:hypothetical protein
LLMLAISMAGTAENKNTTAPASIEQCTTNTDGAQFTTRSKDLTASHRSQTLQQYNPY